MPLTGHCSRRPRSITTVIAFMSNLNHDLVQRYERRLLTYCRKLTRDYDQALDLSQQTWVRVIEYRVTLDTPTRDAFWLLARIARNVFLTNRKRKSNWFPLTNEDEPEVSDSTRLVESEDLLRGFDELIGTLPAPEEAAFRLRFDGKGLTLEEVACALGIPLETAKKRYYRARRRLRAKVPSEWR